MPGSGGAPSLSMQESNGCAGRVPTEGDLMSALRLQRPTVLHWGSGKIPSFGEKSCSPGRKKIVAQNRHAVDTWSAPPGAADTAYDTGRARAQL